MDYAKYSAKALALIARAGLPVQFMRNGSVFAVSQSFASSSQAENAAEGSSDLLAQTQRATTTWLVAATDSPVQVGDAALRDGKTYLVQKVSEFRPAGTLIYQTLEVQ